MAVWNKEFLNGRKKNAITLSYIFFETRIVTARLAPSRSLDSQETAGYGKRRARSGMRNKMAEDRGGTSDLSHLQRANSITSWEDFLFPSYIGSLNQFWNKQYKCHLLCLSLLNKTEMREPSRALSMISHKKRENRNLNTRHSARQLHTAHETDVNTIKETDSMHTRVHVIMQYFRGKKRQLESISCKWHKSLVPSHSSASVICFSSRARSQKWIPRDLSRVI